MLTHSQSAYLDNKKLNQSEIKEKRVMLESRPRRLSIVLTSECSINCIMCERKSNNFTLPRKTLKQIIDFFPYLDSIMWQGGEVFIVDYFRDFFIEAAKYPQLVQEVNTNGLLITEEWAEAIAKANTRLIFSIDSTDKDTYEYIRKGAKFEVLIKNMAMLKEAAKTYKKTESGNIVNVVVMRCNYKELYNFIDFALRYAFKGVNFIHMLGKECPKEDIFNPPDNKAIDYLRRLMPEIIKEADSHGINVTCEFSSLLSKGVALSSKETLLKPNESLFCSLPWRSLFIDGSQEGKVYPECICRIPAGNIFTESLEQIWNNEYMHSYRKKIINNELNGWCNHNCIKGLVNNNFLQGF